MVHPVKQPIRKQIFPFAKMVIEKYNAGMAGNEGEAPNPIKAIRPDIETQPLSVMEKLAGFVRTLEGVANAGEELLVSGDQDGFRQELQAIIEDSGLSGPNQILAAELISELRDLFVEDDDEVPSCSPTEARRQMRIVHPQE